MEYLNNLLYKHLKSESPAWWNTIINDPDIHIEIRKGKYIDAYYNGGAVVKELRWTEESGYRANIHVKYLSDTDEDRYCECPLDMLPDILDDIKKRIATHYPDNSEKGIQSKLILDSNGLYIDCEFQDSYMGRPIRIDLVKIKHGKIVFQELKRIEDPRLLRRTDDGCSVELSDISKQMAIYSDYIRDNKESLLLYFQDLINTKRNLGIKTIPLIKKPDCLTIDPIPELIISDYAEPYTETSRKGQRVKALIEKLDEACIRSSFVNINVDGYVYKHKLLSQRKEKWNSIFDMIYRLEEPENSKSASVQLTGRIVELFEPFDWKSWTEGIDILKEERFSGLDLVTLMKLLQIKIYYQDQAEGYVSLVHCDASIFDDGKILKLLRELKLRYEEYSARQKAIVEKELDEFNVRYSHDSTFAREARLLQSKWRVKKNYPIGKTRNGTPMGNYIDSTFAKEKEVNLLTENIRKIAHLELEEAKSTGALIQEDRLWGNMLSSQPLCFNLFGEMHYDLELATSFFKETFPLRDIAKITNVRFEQAPSRGDKTYTGDHSAFDVFVEYDCSDARKGFIGIEVKYAETLREGIDKDASTFARHREEYIRVSRNAIAKVGPFQHECNIFDMDRIEDMGHAPKFQIWRDHLLALSMIQNNLYDEGFFLFLYPYRNEECHKGLREYKNALHLSFDNTESERCLYGRDIFDFIERLHRMVNKPWSRDLKERYVGL